MDKPNNLEDLATGIFLQYKRDHDEPLSSAVLTSTHKDFEFQVSCGYYSSGEAESAKLEVRKDTTLVERVSFKYTYSKSGFYDVVVKFDDKKMPKLDGIKTLGPEFRHLRVTIEEYVDPLKFKDLDWEVEYGPPLKEKKRRQQDLERIAAEESIPEEPTPEPQEMNPFYKAIAYGMKFTRTGVEFIRSIIPKRKKKEPLEQKVETPPETESKSILDQERKWFKEPYAKYLAIAVLVFAGMYAYNKCECNSPEPSPPEVEEVSISSDYSPSPEKQITAPTSQD
jgi:hypothetical protein